MGGDGWRFRQLQELQSYRGIKGYGIPRGLRERNWSECELGKSCLYYREGWNMECHGSTASLCGQTTCTELPVPIWCPFSDDIGRDGRPGLWRVKSRKRRFPGFSTVIGLSPTLHSNGGQGRNSGLARD